MFPRLLDSLLKVFTFRRICINRQCNGIAWCGIGCSAVAFAIDALYQPAACFHRLIRKTHKKYSQQSQIASHHVSFDLRVRTQKIQLQRKAIDKQRTTLKIKEKKEEIQ